MNSQGLRYRVTVNNCVTSCGCCGAVLNLQCYIHGMTLTRSDGSATLIGPLNKTASWIGTCRPGEQRHKVIGCMHRMTLLLYVRFLVPGIASPKPG